MRKCADQDYRKPRTQILFNALTKRFARMELRDGRVYFIDDYSNRAIYTHKTAIPSRWSGFSHGGTLRSLVEDMRDYVIHGTQIPRWKIVIQQLGHDDLTENIWGITPRVQKRFVMRLMRYLSLKRNKRAYLSNK